MERRDVLTVLGATAAGIAATTITGARAHAGPDRQWQRHAFHPQWGHHTKVQQDCAEACGRCAHECEDACHYALHQTRAGKAEYADAAQLCGDCAEVCATAAKLVARSSPVMIHTCAACAETCDDCHAACERLNDPELELVLEALRQCAQACRGMVQAQGEHQHPAR